MSALSSWQAARIVARATWRQTVRARTLWASALLLSIPVALAPVAAARSTDAWEVVFEILVALLAIVPPLHLAPAVSDEVSEQTFTYLWSRPLPRRAIGLGKFIALAPLVAGGFAVATGAAYGLIAVQTEFDIGALVRAELAIVLGSVAASAVALALGTLIPRHSQAAAIAYLALVDLAVGTIPISLADISLTRHVRRLADTDNSAGMLAALASQPSDAASLLWIAGLGAVWIGATLWWLERAQYAGRKTE